jgi:hypothetical protein
MHDSHPHIEVIRRYLRHASTLPAAEIDRIERHLQSCAFCHDIVREFQDFMKTREAVDLRRVAAETGKLLEKIRTGREPAAQSIAMYPRQEEKRADAAQNRRPVLAAAGETTAAQEFSVVATLFSADERVMLRILLDHNCDEYAIYTLTEKQADAAFLLVQSPLSDSPLMTDEDGMCRTPVRRELLIETDSIRLHPPRQHFSLTKKQAAALSAQEMLRLPLPSLTVTMRIAGEEILLEMSDPGDGTAPVAFAGAARGDNRHTAPCVHGTARLPLLLPVEETRFLIY